MSRVMFAFLLVRMVSVAGGQWTYLSRVDSEPTYGADLATFQRNTTHYTFDLRLTTDGGGWTGTEISLDVVGVGRIWHASDQRLGDPADDLYPNNLLVPDLAPASTDTRAFDTFLTGPANQFFHNALFASIGEIVSTDRRIRGRNPQGQEIPLAWFVVDAGSTNGTFTIGRLTFETPPEFGDLSLDPQGRRLFATIYGVTADIHGHQSTPFNLNIYQQTDCNQNGVPDSVDIAADSTLDCNGNALLDACEIQSDFAAEPLRPAAATVRDGFGARLAIQDDMLIVGAPRDDTRGSNAGSAYVFHRASGRWSLAAALFAPDARASQHFGGAIALAGDRLAIGAPDPDAQVVGRGAVYTYRLDNGHWVLADRLASPPAYSLRGFGTNVTLMGERLAIAAPAASPPTVLIYRRESGAWVEEARLTGASGGRFGSQMVLGEVELVVGEAGRGMVHIFRRETAGWELAQVLSGLSASFGSAVVASADLLVIGSPSEGVGANSGACHVYRRLGESWQHEATLLLESPSSGARLGESVAIQGGRVYSGAPAEWTLAPGAVAVFALDGQGWRQTRLMTLLNGAPGDQFGSRVVIGNAELVVGSQPVSGFDQAWSVRLAADCNHNGRLDTCELADAAASDLNHNSIVDACECLGDVNGDGRVDIGDLGTMLGNFGTPSGMTLADGDLDGNGAVDLTDLSLLLSQFGTTCQ